MPRIICFDDFDRGICGWTQLVGNYEDTLDAMLPGYAQHTHADALDPAELGFRLAWRRRRLLCAEDRDAADAAARRTSRIKRLTFRKRGPIRLEFYFTFKPEATELQLSETDVRSFGFLYDLQVGDQRRRAGQRVMPHLRFLNAAGRQAPAEMAVQARDHADSSRSAPTARRSRTTTSRRTTGRTCPGGEQRLCYNEIPTKVKRVVGVNEGELKEGVANFKETMARIDRSLGNIEAVTEKIRKGEGAVGALISDDRLGQKVSDTVDDLADYAGRLTQMEVEVGVKADYLMTQAAAKTFLQVRLTAKPDKYYLLEAVDDPRGSVTTTYSQQNPPSAGEPAVQKQTVTSQAIKFSAQFAKRYSFLTLRFGIIESSGGLGLDLTLPIKFFYLSRWLEEALVLKVDAFNFSIEALRFPRLRAAIRFTPFEHVYLNAGMDDILNAPNRDTLTNRLISGRDFFVGGGVYFTDADLKSVLPMVPRP